MSFIHQGRTLTKVAVIGSGQIGPDIALYFAKVLSPYGVHTVVVDVAEEALTKGQAKTERKIQKGVDSGAFSQGQQQAMLEHLEFTSDYSTIAGAELVIEAATEDRELKGRIFAQVETLVGADAILASNSSHLEPEVIFAEAAHPERATVIHYFFPAERNPMVEVVPGEATTPAITAWLLSFYEGIGKVPIEVKSRYGYALDPIFEGLFQACAQIAEAGIATTKQIDAIATKALGLTVGSFTAMNLTGGNPITAVGLSHYTTKINSWFRAPELLKSQLESGERWDVPARGEQVEVSDELREKVTRLLQGAYFGLCGEIVDAGLVTVSDLDMGLGLALDMRPAFSFMNRIGTAKALELVEAYAAHSEGFVVPECIRTHAANNTPFEIRSVMRRDVDGTAILTIRRPKVLNALNDDVFAELRQRFEQVETDPSVKAVVLTGFGKKAFVSGADVKFLAKIETPEQGEQVAIRAQAVLDYIEDMSKPVVCALNGLAFGGGVELAMACSMRICKRDLSILAAQPEPNLGIIPGAGGTQRLPRLVGFSAANEILRTGKPISSAIGVEIGLVSEEVEGDLIGRAVELASGMANQTIERPAIRRDPCDDVPDSLPPVKLGHLSTKVDEILCKAILDGAKLSLRDGLALEAKCFGEVCGTEDMRIGVRNFIENGPRSRAEFTHG